MKTFELIFEGWHGDITRQKVTVETKEDAEAIGTKVANARDLLFIHLKEVKN